MIRVFEVSEFCCGVAAVYWHGQLLFAIAKVAVTGGVDDTDPIAVRYELPRRVTCLSSDC